MAVLAIESVRAAINQIAQTTLRNVVGQHTAFLTRENDAVRSGKASAVPGVSRPDGAVASAAR